MSKNWATCLNEARDDADVRVLILTGAGEKSFVAGADINELAKRTPVDGKDYLAVRAGGFSPLETLGKPSIAAINGFALGGGCELRSSARFVSPARTRGLASRKLNSASFRATAARNASRGFAAKASRMN